MLSGSCSAESTRVYPPRSSSSSSPAPEEAVAAAGEKASVVQPNAVLALVDAPPSSGDGDGEFGVLVQSLEDDSVVPLPQGQEEEEEEALSAITLQTQPPSSLPKDLEKYRVEGGATSVVSSSVMKRTRSGTWLHGTEVESAYGNPLTREQAKERIAQFHQRRQPPPPSCLQVYAVAAEEGTAIQKLSSSTTAAAVQPPTGLIHHATLIPDEFVVRGRLLRGLNPRDFENVPAATATTAKTKNPTTSGSSSAAGLQKPPPKIKPRRPTLPITFTELFSSLTKIDSFSGPRYLFYGVLNGWPSLRCLELVAIEARRESSKAFVGMTDLIPTAKEIWAGQIWWKLVWSASGSDDKPPILGGNKETTIQQLRSLLDPKQVYRITLRGPTWSSLGWSKESLGFCFWYQSQLAASSDNVGGGKKKLLHGTDMLRDLCDGESQCSRVHMVSHRYAYYPRRETPRDLLTYHSVVFVEWDHGRYGTVMEAAYLNGMGGYKGKCNWYDDRDAPLPELYRCLPPEMISPWRTTEAEIRCYDVPSRNLAEFRSYVDKYCKLADDKDKRFVDPHYTFTHPCRLSFRTRRHIAQYLLNYIGRDTSYGELSRNCQTFAADLCSFLAGKRSVPPFHPVNRIDYQNRTYLFLYEPALYGGDGKQRASKRSGK